MADELIIEKKNRCPLASRTNPIYTKNYSSH